ncbi:MAG: hypothetical protein COB15_11770 [Flavobacteriales bacterium]|nr:MAG: hypothetical protein COB15_11770 [Flavobacteriales bacterium]
MNKVLLKYHFLFVFVFGISSLLMAQTGPAGVGSTGTNRYWYQAEELGATLVDGDPINNWLNNGGNGDAASQGSGGNQPNWRNSVAKRLNGLSVVEFDGVNDLLAIPDGELNLGAPQIQRSFFVVFRTGANVTNRQIIYEEGGGIRGINIYIFQGDVYVGVWNTNNDGQGAPWAFQEIHASVTANTAYVISLTKNGNITITGTVEAYLNGVALGTINNIGQLYAHSGDVGLGGNNGGTRLETGTNNSGGLNFGGDIAEFIHYNYALNDVERMVTENYLAAKYGVTLGDNDVYNEDNVGAGNYDYEVAGIGRVNATNLHDDAQGSGMVRILNPTGLGNDEFMIWGHDNGVAEATNIVDIPATVQGRFNRVWRVSEVNAAGNARNVGNVDVRWDLTGLGSVTASDLRLLVDTDNDGVFSDETPVAGAVDLGSDIYGFLGVSQLTNNRRFTLATINKLTSPLPIDLISFEANINDDKVDIKWVTASEINNDYFTIERSIDAKNWEEVLVVAGAGNSNQTITYFDSDYEPLTGISYYRLKQTDFNGEFTYSNIVPVKFIKDAVDGNINLFPSPVQVGETVNVMFENIFESELLVVLRDIQGKEYYSKIIVEVEDGKLIGIPIDMVIPPGIYLVTATSENLIYSQRLIVR